MSDAVCQFDAKTHTYTIGDRPVPSVTQVLKVAGLIDTTWFTEEGRIRGQNVAMITELGDMGRLDEDAVPEDLRGYLVAWRKFVADTGCVILEVEQAVCNRRLGYAGTLDRLAKWGLSTTLIDIKLGSVLPWVALQTAAYASCLSPPCMQRCAVYLRPNGTYKCKHHDDYVADLTAFQAALAVANWKVLHGLETYGN